MSKDFESLHFNTEFHILCRLDSQENSEQWPLSHGHKVFLWHLMHIKAGEGTWLFRLAEAFHAVEGE